MFSKTTVAAVTALVASSSAHMIMKVPQPYNFATVETSPLDGTSLQFPCQSGSVALEATNVTQAEAGGTINTQFTGSVVHGGGSCQFSVTYENPPPTDQSKWKVIYTIIGGCPASAAGNLETLAATDEYGRPQGAECGNSDGTECVREFNVPVPKELKNGNATYAWTWFNKIGNREMYMNCAPIEITGGSDDDTYFNSLPSMFVANIPGECTTGEGVLDIPGHGSLVETLEAASAGSSGTCTAASSQAASTGAAAYTTSAAPSASTPAAEESSLAAYNTGGNFAPVAASTSLTTLVVTTTAASAPAASAYAPAADSSSTVAAASPAVSGVPCSTNGAIVCIGDSQFGLCNWGVAVPQDLAAGTTCTDGTISKRDLSHMRHARRARRHAAGALHGSF